MSVRQKSFISLIALCLVVIIPLTGLGFYVYSNDPYWIFHSQPEWVRMTKGQNRVLDTRHRFTKTLQVVAYRPDVILLGSSRVYRGIPTNDGLFREKKAYNFGVSSMIIGELHAYLVHALRWTDAREVIIGLDFFMFDSSNRQKEWFDETISDRTYVFRALLSLLISKSAYEDVQEVNAGDQEKDGFWTRSGFKVSKPRAAGRIAEILRGSCNGRNPVTQAEYEIFRDVLDLLSEDGIKTRIFISPLNNRLVAKMKRTGQYDGFLQWKKRVSAIASEYGICVHDFSERNPFYHNYPERRSNRYWIDATHYSPGAGRWIIRTMEKHSRNCLTGIPHRSRMDEGIL